MTTGFEPVRTQDAPVLTDHSLPIAFLGEGHVLVGSKSHVQELRRERGATFWQSQPLFSAEQIKATPELDKIASLFTESDGTLWLGCGKGTLQPHMRDNCAPGARRTAYRKAPTAHF